MRKNYSFEPDYYTGLFQYSYVSVKKAPENMQEMLSVSREMEPFSPQTKSIRREIKPLSLQTESVRRETEYIFRQTRFIRWEMKSIRQEMKPVWREMKMISCILFSFISLKTTGSHILIN